MIPYATLYSLLVILFLTDAPPSTYNEPYVIRLLVGVAILSGFFVFESYRHKRLYLLTPSLICFAGILIVHFQRYLDLVLGFDVTERDLYSTAVVPQACAVSLLGIASYVLGYMVEVRAGRAPKPLVNPRPYSVREVTILAAVLYGLFLLTVARMYVMGYYDGGRSWSRAATLIYLLYNAAAYGILVISYHNCCLDRYHTPGLLNYVRRIGYAPTMVIAVNVAMSLYVGDRGPVISFGTLYFAYYFIHCKRLSALKSVSIVLVAMVLMSLIALTRTSQTLDDRNVIERMVEGGAQMKEHVASSKSAFPFTAELAGSVRCLHVAIDNIPDVVEYGAGRYTFINLATLVPFVGQVFFKNADYYLSTSRLYTDLLTNYNPDSAGYGTTVMADFYAEYGSVAVAVGMLLLGYFMSMCDRVLYSGRTVSLFLLCVVLCYLSRGLYISRALATIPLKMAVFCFLIVVVLRHVGTQQRVKP